MPKVYSYRRFSHIQQAGGDSIRRQRDKAEQWAEKNGYTLDTELKLDDMGKSAFDGTNLKTGALGQFLALARAGKIERGSILAIEAFDRLTRAEPLDAFHLLSDLVRAGISVVTVADGRVYDANSLNRDLTALMMAAVMLVRGHEESRRKSEMLQAHYSRRRAEGAERIGHAPPGWLRPSASGGWELIPEHAATIREIFDLTSRGFGATVLARKFNSEARATPSRREGNGWYPSRISKLLRKREVLGEYQPHVMDGEKMLPLGEPLKNYYPSVIGSDLFWRVQSVLDSRAPKGRRKDGGYRNFLSGMLKCGYCGGTFTLDKKGGNHLVDKFFYNCMNSGSGYADCDNRINYKTLIFGAAARTSGRYQRPQRLSMMLPIFEHLLLAGHNPQGEDEKLKIKEKLTSLASEKEDALKRKQNLLNAIETGVLSLGEVGDRLDKIRAQLDFLDKEEMEINKKMQEIAVPDAWVLAAAEEEIVKLIDLVGDLEATSARAELRERLGVLIESIHVFRDHAVLKLKGQLPVLIPLVDGYVFS